MARPGGSGESRGASRPQGHLPGLALLTPLLLASLANACGGGDAASGAGERPGGEQPASTPHGGAALPDTPREAPTPGAGVPASPPDGSPVPGPDTGPFPAAADPPDVARGLPLGETADTVAAAAGARAADAARPEPARHDSAGVTILTYTLAQLDRVPRIEPDTLPLLVIGAADGPPGMTLNQVRSVLGRADGGVVLADDGGTVIRAYDEAGRYLGAQGRAGDGPGEYRQIRGLWWLPGDSLAVYDQQLMRLSVLDPELRYVRSLRVPLDPPGRGVPPVLGGLSGVAHGLGSLSGVMLVRASTPSGVPDLTAPQPMFDPRVDQDTLAVVLLQASAGGLAADTVHHVLGLSWMVVPTAGPSGFVSGASRSTLQFGASPFVSGNAAGFIVAHGSRFEIKRFDADGQLRFVIRVAAEPRPVTSREREATSGGATRRPAFAEHHPLLTSVELDAAGNAWVLPDETLAGGRGWIVFGSEGEVLAWQRAPAGFARYRGADYFLAVTSDDMQVQRIVKYPIRPLAPGPSGH